MMEWKEVKLGDVCDVITKGTTPSNIGDSFVDEGIKFIRSEMLGRDKYINNSGFLFISEETHQRLRRSQLKEKDILFSMAGVYLGKTAILRKEDVPSNTNQAVAIIRVNGTKADVEYIYYCLNHPHIVKTVNASCAQSAQPNINLKQIGEISFLTPPLGIQQRIASILSSLDDKIAVNRRICENLEAQAQALFKNWFVDFAPFKDGKFVESELGMIPEGWRVGRLTEIIKLLPGGTPKTTEPSFWDNGNIPFFSPKDVTGIYCYDTEKHITEAGLNKCSSGLYAKDTIFITCRGTVGKITMSACDMAMNQSNYAIKGIDGYSQYYIFFLMRSIVERLLKKANGAVFSAITTKDFDEAVIIPPLNVIKDFNECIKPTFTKIYTIGKENQHLASIRDTLLPKLMSGEIKI